MNTAAAQKKADALFAGPCVFALGVDSLERIPREALPEVAFIGRSNVGKSSLLNAITGQKLLARVSNTPGRTQQLNFFRVSDRLYLVDMPGYGYAKAAKESIREWSGLIETYVTTRSNLRRLLLLIDARHGFKDNDMAFIDMLNEHAIPFAVVLTKTDKVKAAALKSLVVDVEATVKTLPAAWPHVFLTSAEKKEGLNPLRLFLGQYAI